MGNKGKAKARKRVATKAPAPKDLAPKDVKQVKGGRKAGDKPLEYLNVTMKEVIISS